MSTPLEIVRAQVKWWHEASDYSTPPSSAEEYHTALAAVLRDAERFKALERAQGSGDMDVWTTDGLLGPRGKWLSYGGTLSELADRLREKSTT